MKTVYEVATAETAHQATNELYRNFVKPQVLEGTRGRLIWEPLNTNRRKQLRKLFHGPVLEAFAYGVRLPDLDNPGRTMRFMPQVWKRHLMNLFHPLIESTEELDDDEFSDFILQCEAYGVMECGIEFPEKETPHVAPHRV